MSYKTLFIIYRMVSRLYFHLPVVFLIFWSLNLSFFVVMIIIASYGFSSNMATIVLPKLSEKLNAKKIIILGEILKALGLYLVLIGCSIGKVDIIYILAGQLIGGVGFSLSLSADNTLMREIANGNNDIVRKIQSQTQSGMFLATLVAGFLGGILFQYNVTWPLVVGVNISFISVATIFLIKSNSVPAGRKINKGLNIIQLVDKETKKWIFYYAIFRALALAPFVGLLPFYFQLRNVDPYFFGLVLGLFTLGGFFFATYGLKLIKSLHSNSLFPLMCTALIISYSTFIIEEFSYFNDINLFFISLFGVFFLGLAAGSIRTIIMPKINIGDLKQDQQILIFSYMEKLFGYFNTFLLLIIGILVTYYNVEYVFLFIVFSIIFITIKEADF